MLTAIAVLVTFAVAMAVWRSKSWVTRLRPVLLIGGAHLVYNCWAVALAGTSTSGVQLVYTFGAFASFAVFALLVRGRHSSSPTDGTERRTILPIRCASGALAILFLIGLITFVYLTARAGTVPVLAADPNAARVTFLPNGYLSTLLTVPLKVVILMCGFELLSAERLRRTRISTIMYFVVSAAILSATANRGLIVQPLIPLLMYAAVRYRWRVRTLALWGVAALIGFSFAGFQRALAAYGPSYLDDVQAAGFSGPLRYLYPLADYVSGTSKTFDRTLQIFPQLIPFQNGNQLFGPFFHHQSTDLYLKGVFGLDFEGFGVALGAMNSFYLDFGTLGIVFGFAIGGVLAQYFYSRALRRPAAWLPAYFVVATNFLLSNYGSPIAYVATVATPALAVYLLIRRTKVSDSSYATPEPHRTNRGRLVEWQGTGTDQGRSRNATEASARHPAC